MKKFFFCLVLLVPLTSAIAGDADIFRVDKKAVNASFRPLDELENYIQSSGENIIEIKEKNPVLVEASGVDIKAYTSYQITQLAGDDDDKKKIWLYVSIGVGVLLLLSVVGCFMAG